MKDRQQAYHDAMKTAKRIAITMLCCLPVLIIFAFLMRNIITNNAIQILCFVLIMGVVVLVEELIYRKAKKKKEKIQKENKDVFK